MDLMIFQRGPGPEVYAHLQRKVVKNKKALITKRLFIGFQ